MPDQGAQIDQILGGLARLCDDDGQPRYAEKISSLRTRLAASQERADHWTSEIQSLHRLATGGMGSLNDIVITGSRQPRSPTDPGPSQQFDDLLHELWKITSDILGVPPQDIRRGADPYR